MKKFLCFAFAAAFAVTLFTGCSQQEPVEIPGAFDYLDPTKISERIDALSEDTGTSKISEIYSLIHDCKGLIASDREKVTNYEKIDEALHAEIEYFNEEDVKLKVMSFNVRNGEYGNGRMPLLLSTIMEESPDLVGLQEVGEKWKPFFKENLADTGYVKLGHGRYQTGHSEESSILYKKDKFDLLASDTMWMTDTPELESAWTDPETGDRGFPRIMTYALLRRKSDGAVFVFANTHLETCDPAQTSQAYWLMQHLITLFGNQYPVILTGDFNCVEGSSAYSMVTSYGFEPTNKYGESTGTFNAYSYKNGEGKVIDFCFVNEYIPIESYKVMPATVNDQFVSDHNGIVAEVLVFPDKPIESYSE